MSFSRAFQWYHSHLDPIWPDGTFNGLSIDTNPPLFNGWTLLLKNHLNGLNFVPLLVLGVHRHKLEDHEVEDGGDDGETEHDEEEGEGDVFRLLFQGVVLLQGHQVPKSWPLTRGLLAEL